MSLLSLRPYPMRRSPAIHLPTSALDNEKETEPAKDRLSQRQPSSPIGSAASLANGHILLAQEASEEDLLRERASRMWRESQERICIDEDEMTPDHHSAPYSS